MRLMFSRLLPAASLILGAQRSRYQLLKRVMDKCNRGRTAFRVVLLATVSLALRQPHAAAAPAADPAQPFGQAWSALPGSAGWQMGVSAPFPLHWPPEPGEPPVRYAFAMRLRAGLADGAEVAAPWARSMEVEDGTTAVTLLRAGLEPIGIQGVRPVRPAESALIAREGEAEQLLRAGKADPLVRATTCGWVARNGVVAAAIVPLHPAFTHWLACGTVASLPLPGSR